ncbi:MAG: hypothetical protein R3C46_07070 [Hyphomonadaceae bacterium]
MTKPLMIAGGLLLAATPAILTALWPEAGEAGVLRKVEVSGPIESFEQTRDRIQVRLHPAASDAERQARHTVVITGAGGATLSIPLKPGQTWASSELPPALAEAGMIEISVR